MASFLGWFSLVVLGLNILMACFDNVDSPLSKVVHLSLMVPIFAYVYCTMFLS